MPTEFEAKFLDITPDEIRAKLKAIGAELKYPERTMQRVLFQTYENPNMNVDYLRVRDEGDGKITVSAKDHAHPDGELSDQKELEVSVSDYQTMIKILELSGLVLGSRQETKRELWVLDGAEVTIDTWPGIDTYIEIESDSEEHVHEVADKLGVSWDNKVITSVVHIFMKKYGLGFKETEEKLRNISFENNPFE